jgi:hypothetical protein
MKTLRIIVNWSAIALWLPAYIIFGVIVNVIAGAYNDSKEFILEEVLTMSFSKATGKTSPWLWDGDLWIWQRRDKRK